MIGALYVDGIDVFVEYGVYIIENGYNGLLSFPALKELEKVDWAERDGIDVDLSDPKLNSKKFSISFCAKTIIGLFDFMNTLADASYHNFMFAEIGIAKRLRVVEMKEVKSDGLKFFELEFSDDSPLTQYCGFVIGNENLIDNSIVYEESNLYGFGYRSVQVEAGNTYTFSVRGNAANATGGKSLHVYIYKNDWSWAQGIQITESENVIKSITFSVTETLLLNISSYYYDVNNRETGSVYVDWYKLEKGSVATNYVESPADIYSKISEYQYVEPFSSTQSQYLYSLDSFPLDYYGVALLAGSDDEIIKIPAVKENLEINTSAINGSIYDNTALKFKEKDVRLNCLLLANDIFEFWRNYNALLYDLSKPGYRSFEYNSVVYECFYKSSSVKRFSNVNKIWCEFELNLVFVRHENI